MSKRRTTQSKPRNNNWAMLVIGLLFGGGLIAPSIFSTTKQITADAALAFIGADGYLLWNRVLGFIATSGIVRK